MPLSAGGDQLGPYKILASIGAGGMGEVYRAQDAKLGRDVALKVLPAGDGARSRATGALFIVKRKALRNSTTLISSPSTR